ncbi:MAG: tetratricopeptide repeat protein [Desulfobacteraceae bacterium]|nr:tetratricopeptide repeat protein [Desulfobacteraceae bacterium]
MTAIGNKKDTFLHIRHDIWVSIFIFISIIAVYWQVRNHDFVNFDDDRYVTDNYRIKSGLTAENITWAFTAFHVSNWHPLTWLSHMVDYQLFGLNPGKHHIFSVMLHIANSLLLLYLLRRMTGSLWRSSIVAALFALHPVHVESVAWISERKDVLSTFFWMLCLFSYIGYVERPGVLRYSFILLFFALGLMAKPMVITLPFVFLLLDFWPLCRLQLGQEINTICHLKRKAPVSRLLLEKSPLFLMTAASGVITFVAQSSGGAVQTFTSFPLPVRIANALTSYLKYMEQTLWPTKMAVLYPHPHTVNGLKVAGASLLLMAISFLAVKTVRQYPFIIVGWLWFLGTLVPVIGLVQVGVQAMADRYTYIPLIGIFIIIAWSIPGLLASKLNLKIPLASLLLLSIAVLALLTWKQVGYWKNSTTLFKHAIGVTKNNYISYSNLGQALAEQGRISEGIAHLYESLRIKPDYAIAHNNLGTALERQGRLKEAVKHYTAAVRIAPSLPAAHYNLGVVLHRQGNIKDAADHYIQTLRVMPDHARAHNNLGVALEHQGYLEEAVIHYSEALRIQPDYPDARRNLKIALQKKGQFAK